jgi:hypothetical protein
MSTSGILRPSRGNSIESFQRFPCYANSVEVEAPTRSRSMHPRFDQNAASPRHTWRPVTNWCGIAFSALQPGIGNAGLWFTRLCSCDKSDGSPRNLGNRLTNTETEVRPLAMPLTAFLTISADAVSRARTPSEGGAGPPLVLAASCNMGCPTDRLPL